MNEEETLKFAYEEGAREANDCRRYRWQVTCPYDMRTKMGRAFMAGYRERAATLEAEQGGKET